MRYVAFALGFSIGALARPAKLTITFYYPKSNYAEGLDERRRASWEWSTSP